MDSKVTLWPALGQLLEANRAGAIPPLCCQLLGMHSGCRDGSTQLYILEIQFPTLADTDSLPHPAGLPPWERPPGRVSNYDEIPF